MDGEYDHLPEQAFYMVGGIDEAVEKAKSLLSCPMTDTMKCKVVSAEQALFEGDVRMVIASGDLGDLGITLDIPVDHLPKPGPVRVVLRTVTTNFCSCRVASLKSSFSNYHFS